MRKRWKDLPAFSQAAAAAANASDPMAITSLRGWRLREPVSQRRYTVIRIETRGGLTGYGEGGPVKGIDISDTRPMVVGKLASDLELVRLQLAGWPALEAAVNNALLDILGKSTKAPIYQFLGGPVRYKARVLAHLEGDDTEALVASLRRAQQAGFKAFCFPIPPWPPMTRIQSYADSLRKRFDQLRIAGGEDADFVLDAGGSLEPGDAASIATQFEKLHPLWLDEPTDVLTIDALAKVTAESVLPVGVGRTLHDVASFQNLLRGQTVGVLRPSLGLNSLLKIRRMAAVAEVDYVAIAPHHSGGPIATLAGIHLAATLANFFIQQVPQPAAGQDRAMRAELVSGNYEAAQDGYAPLINKPGLGIQVSEQALAKYSEETI
jgi:galactonate dehydratase